MNAMNSMLKFLEEPPKGLYFFLIVDELTNVLPTIQSRSQKLFFQNHSFESCKKILNENTQSEQKDEIENLIKLSNFSPGISLEILTSSGIELYIDLLETFLKKEKIRSCSKKIVSNTKNQITNIWIVEFLLKRLLSNCLKYSINDQFVINNLILNEKKIIIHILNIKNINELLELLDDLNYRLTRVKTFNSSLEFEIFQFLNRFH
tara:strand:- start:437 stop:1054 length:618 start_codon:yes stop_codon:yes gene_type:complete